MSAAEELLDYAGSYLAEDPKRWLQGELSDYNGAVCAYGAIDLARGHVRHVLKDVIAAERALSTVIADNYPTALRYTHGEDAGIASIPSWNDDPARTHKEVVEILEKARAYAAEQGL